MPTANNDRRAWDKAWATMPQRRLIAAPKIEATGRFGEALGALVSATVSGDPPEYSDMNHRPSETCPICGDETLALGRIPATLGLTFAGGVRYGLGVWVHQACFESCPEADGPKSVPC